MESSYALESLQHIEKLLERIAEKVAPTEEQEALREEAEVVAKWKRLMPPPSAAAKVRDC